nr:unnamed protein product [Digitaria exilis]
MSRHKVRFLKRQPRNLFAARPVYGSFTRCDDCALALDAIDPLTLRPEPAWILFD